MYQTKERIMNNTVAGKPGQDPTLPDVELIAGGKTFHLAYDFNAIVVAEEQTGANLLGSVMGTIDARSLRGLLWASLLKENPDMTIDQAGKLIRPTNIGTIRQAIVTAWFGSVADKDDDSGEAPETPAE
jgi:hypothetical protein